MPHCTVDIRLKYSTYTTTVLCSTVEIRLKYSAYTTIVLCSIVEIRLKYSTIQYSRDKTKVQCTWWTLKYNRDSMCYSTTYSKHIQYVYVYATICIIRNTSWKNILSDWVRVITDHLASGMQLNVVVPRPLPPRQRPTAPCISTSVPTDTASRCPLCATTGTTAETTATSKAAVRRGWSTTTTTTTTITPRLTIIITVFWPLRVFRGQGGHNILPVPM